MYRNWSGSSISVVGTCFECDRFKISLILTSFHAKQCSEVGRLPHSRPTLNCGLLPGRQDVPQLDCFRGGQSPCSRCRSNTHGECCQPNGRRCSPTSSLLQRQVFGEAAEDKQCLARPQGRNSKSPCKRTITLRPSQQQHPQLFFSSGCAGYFSPCIAQMCLHLCMAHMC